MLVVCPLQSIIIDYLIAEASRMGMPAASIADISDGESRSAKFKLLFGVWLSRKNMNIFQLTPPIKAFLIYRLNSECFGTALAANCQFFRATFFRRAMISF